MKKGNYPNLDNFHELFANVLVFLSLGISLFLFGIVFVSDHEAQIAAQSHNLLAQASSIYLSASRNNQLSKFNTAYSKSKFIYRYPDDNLTKEMNKIWEQLNIPQYIKDDH